MQAERTRRDAVRIVQCAREIGPGMGVGGPAYELERQFIARGYRCERFTLENLGVRPRSVRGSGALAATLRLWRDVVVFSTLGTLVLWWRYRIRGRGTVVVLCHVDALFGDLFVLRSLHKAYLKRRRHAVLQSLRNPLHLFVLARDWVRFRCRIHRHVIALSQTNAQELCTLYGLRREAIHVIPNGVDCERFKPDPAARASVRAATCIDGETFVLLFVANEFERKGLEPLLRALLVLQRSTRDFHLLVAGGDDPGAYRHLLEDTALRVTFLGHRRDIERYYAAADVLVLPTRHDVSPLVGLEAMACGLPVLMTAIGGARDYLRDNETGYFITPDAEDIAARVMGLLGDPEQRARMGRLGRETARRHQWSDVAQRYVELIEECAS